MDDSSTGKAPDREREAKDPEALERQLETLDGKVRALQDQLEKLQKRQKPVDVSDPLGAKQPPQESGPQAKPEGKGICYTYMDCTGAVIDTDVTFAECFGMDGRSWKGAGGCFNIHGYGGRSVALSVSAAPDMTTRTRKQCTWAVVVRRSEGQVIVDTSRLRTRVHSDEIVSESTQRTELSRIITQKLSAEVAHEITGLGFTSTAGASLTSDQVRQAVDTYVATHQFVLVHYVVTIEGTVVVRRDWKISEVWDWHGRDCAVSEPELVSYVLRGPDLEVNIRTQFDIWEMYAPRSDKPRGREWAEAEARFQHDALLQRGAWLPELPLPGGFPASPNIG